MRNRVALLVRLVASAIIPVATIVTFATLAIYTGNTMEFASAYVDLLVLFLPYAATVVVVLVIPGLLLTSSGLKRYVAVLNMLAILFWLQGSILVWQYGALDGSAINWLDNVWRGVLDTVVWVVLLTFSVYGFRRFGNAMFIAAIATFFIQAIASVTSIGKHPEIFAVADLAENVESRDAVMQFSSEFNVVQIVMDGFQSDIFAAILADKSDHDIAEQLRGFTYFDQHLGAYPYTQLTMPAMLSGRLFHNEVPVDDFVRSSIAGNTVTNSAYAEGFEVDIMAQTPLRNVYAFGRHTNAYGITSSGHVKARDVAVIDAAKLIDLALFRVVAHFGKALVYRDELWVFQGIVQDRSYLHLQYFSDLHFLANLKKEMTVARDVPVFKLIHVMLSHRPFVGNASCEFDGRKPESREAVVVHARCGLLGVLEILQRMQELGIYDSSLIVLMADHGAWIPVENFTASDDVSATTVAMATPMLAVKPQGAMHPFRTSAAPTSIIDLPATIAELAGLTADFPGQSVYSIDENAARERTHLTYGYGPNTKAREYLFPMQEWRVVGDPYDAQSWQRGRRYKPRGQ